MKKSDRFILLKSSVGVTAVVVLLLLGITHRNTPPLSDRSVGAETFLLVSTPGDVAYLRRWQKIHDPANIFGYNGKGVFSAALPDEEEIELPRIGRFTGDEVNLLISEKSKHDPLQLKAGDEQRAVKDFITPLQKLPAKQWNYETMPVYGSGSSIICEIRSVRSSLAAKPLLLRSSAVPGGSSFSLLESSGDNAFDRSVMQQLAAAPEFVKGYTGVIAVWPEQGNKVMK